MDDSDEATYRLQYDVRNRTKLFGLNGWGVVKGSQVKTEINSVDRHQSDLELVRRAREGDPDAFASLFNAHKTKIYSLCLRMTSNTAEAEDLTQDAFLQAFRKLATFRGDSALSTWLYRVAVNTVLMHMRKKGLRVMSLDQPLEEPDGTVKREQGKLDDRLSGCVDRIALTRAMKELPAGYRTIFVLHEVKGYEHHEIAHLLHCSVGNSKSQLHKAKTRMRELLGLEEAYAMNKARSRQAGNAPDADLSSQGLNWELASEAA
jgi:RNA polymerase sigma-70 factor (ECF subfamily)